MSRVRFSAVSFALLALALGPLASLADASKVEPGHGLKTAGSSTLAFTGINTDAIVLLGAALLALGLLVRLRLARSRS